jgi:very-short-patch-repair endonuclease
MLDLTRNRITTPSAAEKASRIHPSLDKEGSKRGPTFLKQGGEKEVLYNRCDMHFKNKPENKDFRKELRRTLTPAEAAMWNVLKGGKLDGRKFRRQHGVGVFVLDFYCPAELLAVELDGLDHMLLPGGTRDSERTRFLRHFGIRVIRFENDLVFKDIEWVVDVIRSHFGWKLRGEEPTPWIPSKTK